MTSILTQEELRREIIRLVDRFVDILKPCFGPDGHGSVFQYQDIQKKWRSAQTKNSNMLLGAIELEAGSVEALLYTLVHSNLVTEGSQDGVITAYILLQSMLQDGIHFVESGIDPLELRKGIDAGIQTAVQFVFQQTTPICELSQLWAVAKTAAGEKEIADFIVQAFSEVGLNGRITVEESQRTETVLDYTDAFELPYGYNSPEFHGDNGCPDMTLENPYLLITDMTISDFQDLLPVMQAVHSVRGQLVVLAPSVEGSALVGLIKNKRAGVLHSVCVDIKGLDYRRRDNLRDLAAYTGGTFITAELGMRLREVCSDHLGRANQVTVSTDRTIVSSGKGKAEDISKQIHEAEVMLRNSRTETEMERHRVRLSNLTGGTAVLRVGGTTELEMREKKLRFDKALTAAGAALEHGIVPGGGSIYLMATKAVLESAKRFDSQERQAGVKLVARALEAPMRQLADNAGISGSFLISKIKEMDPGVCFCIDTQEIGCARDHQIMDATAVVCQAIYQSGSLASSLLTLNGLCADTEPLVMPKKRKLL